MVKLQTHWGYSGVSLQKKWCSKWLFVAHDFFGLLPSRNFGTKRTWIWPTSPGDGPGPGSRPNNPNGSNFGLLPWATPFNGWHLSAPEMRQRMKRPWGAKSTSMSRPCHGTCRPLGSKASSWKNPTVTDKPRKMNGRNAGKKCLGEWIWIINYKVTQKCGKVTQKCGNVTQKCGKAHSPLWKSNTLPRAPCACQEKLVAKSMKGTGTLPVPSTSQLRGRGSASISTSIGWYSRSARQHDPPEMAEPFFFRLTNWNSWAVYPWKSYLSKRK